MTPVEFKAVAAQVAGPRWRTRLGPMIGKCRTQVWEYATGKRRVPTAVGRLMQILAEHEPAA